MKNILFFDFSARSLLIFPLFLLVACGGGGSGGTPPAVFEDASGLYQGTGTVNGATELLDIKGMAQNNRFILFDAGENILYDGQIQSITGQNISAVVDVYKDGLNVSQSIATGTVVKQDNISLTLTGSKHGSGTLSLNYDTTYEEPATLSLFRPQLDGWSGSTNSVTVVMSSTLIYPNRMDSSFVGQTSPGKTCSYLGGITTILDSLVNIYTVSFNVSHDISMACDHIGMGYTGFAMVADAVLTADREMWFAATNGTNSNFSIMGDIRL